MQAVLSPGYDKALSIRKLKTMVDFMLVLTIFGSFNLEWDAKYNECLRLIDEYTKDLAGKEEIKGLSEKVAKESELPKNSDKPARFRIEFEEIMDSVYVKSKGEGASQRKAQFAKMAQSQPDDSLEDLVLPEESLSLIHICRCRRLLTCRSRWSPYH
eukprot:TRINITY_DN1258_c0_g1_i1.p1 TRINITY_DN1258_c0_g1~~TRINITY_DN1258_c0_g1_i1.p1  ORF type:complete len:157 (+),score=25.67 TRINITY_DN1258_c0_g1_i1:108-578(+)